MNKKAFKKSGFYIALCLCIAVISAVAYIGNQSTFPKDKNTSDTVEIHDSEPTLTPRTPVPTKKPVSAVTASPVKTAKPINTTAKPIASSVKATSNPVKTTASQNIKPSPTPTPTVENNFKTPLVGDIITTFSNGALIYDKYLDDWRSHNGIDIKSDVGSDVKAVFSGTITDISETANGKTIKIDHKNGYVSVYSNLDENVSVNVNDSVNTGDVIGKVGKTSIAEKFAEPHLHLELLENGKYVDPNKYIH